MSQNNRIKHIDLNKSKCLTIKHSKIMHYSQLLQYFIFSFTIIQLLYYKIWLSSLDNYYANKIYNTKIINIYDNEILLAISKNVKYSKVIIICHSVCSNYKELATLANELIKNDCLVISYSRNAHEKQLKHTNFNIVGCIKILHQIIILVNKTYNKPIYLIGISAGSSLVALYTGKYAHKLNSLNIVKSFLISPGYNFQYSMYKMPYFASLLCYLNVYYFFKSKSILDILKTQNLKEYCDIFYKQLNYKSKNHYYIQNNPIYYLDKIKIKSYFINAKDDFVFPYFNIKSFIKYASLNPNIKIILTNIGSHNSFKYNFLKNPYYFDFIIKKIRD